MSDTSWYESYFGEDYLEIHHDDLTRERSEVEANQIATLLGLKPGSRVLDLACGHGRHAIPLARMGIDVTGYDLSEVFLANARSESTERRESVRWIRGDMRALPFESEFDAVISIFTAFGYFADPKDDLRVLRGVRRALVPGGRFLLESIHRDGLLSRFRKREWRRVSTGAVVLRERSLDLVENVMHEEVALIRGDGTRSTHRFEIRMRTLQAYLSVLREAGLEPEEWYGGLSGENLEFNSWRMAVISRRED